MCVVSDAMSGNCVCDCVCVCACEFSLTSKAETVADSGLEAKALGYWDAATLWFSYCVSDGLKKAS